MPRCLAGGAAPLAVLGWAALALAGCASPAPEVTASATPGPSVAASPGPSPNPSPTFTWESRTATAGDALTWTEDCPVGLDALVVVDVAYWTFEGEAATGELVINADIETEARAAFAALFDQGFPLTSVRNIDEFAGSDDASMAADNTSAYNCRYAVADGVPSWSKHAYGRAIDINPVENPYVFHGEAMPPEGEAYVDRGERPGMLVDGGAGLAAFEDAGFGWGGVWTNPDYQHVEVRP